MADVGWEMAFTVEPRRQSERVLSDIRHPTSDIPENPA